MQGTLDPKYNPLASDSQVTVGRLLGSRWHVIATQGGSSGQGALPNSSKVGGQYVPTQPANTTDAPLLVSPSVNVAWGETKFPTSASLVHTASGNTPNSLTAPAPLLPRPGSGPSGSSLLLQPPHRSACDCTFPL